MSKRIAPVIDIFPQLVASSGVTPDTVRQEIARLKEMHDFQRIYCVVSNPGYPMFSDPWNALLPVENCVGNRILSNLIRLGDPNWLFAREIKRQGAEVFAVMKPYELGGGRSVALGATTSPYERGVEDVGGLQTGYDSLLSAHPEYAVERFPYDSVNENEPIVRIELSYLLDAMGQNVSRLERTTFPEYSDALSEAESRYALYVSDDNGTFVRLPVEPNVCKRVVREVPRNANGYALSEEPVRKLVVELSGFSIDARFIAVAQEAGEVIHIIPQSMIRAFCESGEVPVTVTDHIRMSKCPQGEAHVWGNEWHPRMSDDLGQLHDFERCGFEFDWHGSGFWGDGWVRSPLFGIARGKRHHMKGTPCEGYPEVRAYWLDCIERLLDMGYDGIDLRLQNHSAMVCDWASFGWNEPIRRRYEEMFSRALDPENYDPMDIMRVRGSYYMEFLREAAKLIHGRGKKLQIHLRESWEHPTPSHEFNQLAFWAMPKILPDWREAVALADEITLKDYHNNHYEAGWSAGVKALCRELNKPLWIHLYLAQGRELNEGFLSDGMADEGVTGVLIYEVTEQCELHGTNPLDQMSLVYLKGGNAYENPAPVQALKRLVKQFSLI